MLKHIVIESISKNLPFITDGQHFILAAEHFRAILEVEARTGVSVVSPQNPEMVGNIASWKERLVIMIQNRMKFHDELRIVFRKEPDREGRTVGLYFDAFMFYNLDQPALSRFRTLFDEPAGLYRTYAEILSMPVKPYYAKLLPIPDGDNRKGIWILRKFF